MNLTTLKLIFNGANGAWKYFREQDDKQQREIYDALVEALKNDDIDQINDLADVDELEGLYGAARAQAGDVTRGVHDRLDRRRAAFDALLPARRERQEDLRHEAKVHKERNKSAWPKVLGVVGGVAVVGAAGWAAWELWLRDKVQGDEADRATVYKPAPTRTETNARGEATLVYSTRTEDDLERGAQDQRTRGVVPEDAEGRMGAGASTGQRIVNDPDNEQRPNVAGPLGEDPAERDEELLTSLDQQLSTLDTLDDEQREATSGGRHELKDETER